MSELFTIDRTPTTDLEKFQALRIEALEKELQKLVKEIQTALENHVNNIEVVEAKFL